MIKTMGAAAAVGGIIGAWLRYGISLLYPFDSAISFPYATLFINVIGAAFLGWFTAYIICKQNLSPYWRTFIGTGFTGAFTTYSTFALETVQLIQMNRLLTAIIYQGLTIVLGIGAAAAGYRCGMQNRSWEERE
ncbi:fluoride efflux transporter CrcB [Paenibacillus sp. SC116]|uniref:fluoride efflux transporter CrcB n=1 Tax=Paenibacillus sp. SC116 TaxID=2968986 RepID=UPI00215B6CE0|nr:fluoride efflux transporter CrcB [Paenibacillus sp. SC116]MCR8845982.1 fluoride efflux transporter CrcB [Paenibacillus sp. SC116]